MFHWLCSYSLGFPEAYPHRGWVFLREQDSHKNSCLSKILSKGPWKWSFSEPSRDSSLYYRTCNGHHITSSPDWNIYAGWHLVVIFFQPTSKTIFTWSYWSSLSSKSNASSEQRWATSGLINLFHGLLGHFSIRLVNSSSNLMLYFFRYLNSYSVPRTFVIFTSWSLLSLPIKKGSLRKIWNYDCLYHGSKHGSSRPHVQWVVVVHIINQQLRPFKVSWSHSDIVVLTRMVEFSQSPVNQLQLLLRVIYNDILWFDIAMHNASGMTVVQCLP